MDYVRFAPPQFVGHLRRPFCFQSLIQGVSKMDHPLRRCRFGTAEIPCSRFGPILRGFNGFADIGPALALHHLFIDRDCPGLEVYIIPSKGNRFRNAKPTIETQHKRDVIPGSSGKPLHNLTPLFQRQNNPLPGASLYLWELHIAHRVRRKILQRLYRIVKGGSEHSQHTCYMAPRASGHWRTLGVRRE